MKLRGIAFLAAALLLFLAPAAFADERNSVGDHKVAIDQDWPTVSEHQEHHTPAPTARARSSTRAASRTAAAGSRCMRSARTRRPERATRARPVERANHLRRARLRRGAPVIRGAAAIPGSLRRTAGCRSGRVSLPRRRR